MFSCFCTDNARANEIGKKVRKRLNTTSGALSSTLPLVKMVCLQGLVVFQYGEWKAATPWGRGWSALLLVTVVNVVVVEQKCYEGLHHYGDFSDCY